MRVGARDLGFGIATAHQWRQKKAENAKVRCGKREVVAGPLLIHWWTRRYLKSRKQGELHWCKWPNLWYVFKFCTLGRSWEELWLLELGFEDWTIRRQLRTRKDDWAWKRVGIQVRCVEAGEYRSMAITSLVANAGEEVVCRVRYPIDPWQTVALGEIRWWLDHFSQHKVGEADESLGPFEYGPDRWSGLSNGYAALTLSCIKIILNS